MVKKLFLQKINKMYWTLELASYLSDAPWPANKDELIDYAIRTGAPLEVVENLQAIEDEEEEINETNISENEEKYIKSQIFNRNFQNIKLLYRFNNNSLQYYNIKNYNKYIETENFETFINHFRNCLISFFRL